MPSDPTEPFEYFNYMNTDEGTLTLGDIYNYRNVTLTLPTDEFGAIENRVSYYVCPKTNNSNCVQPGSFALRRYNIGTFTYLPSDGSATLHVDTNIAVDNKIYYYFEFGLEGFEVDSENNTGCPYSTTETIISGTCSDTEISASGYWTFSGDSINLNTTWQIKDNDNSFTYNIPGGYSGNGGFIYLKRLYLAYSEEALGNISDGSDEFPYSFDSSDEMNNEYAYEYLNNLQPTDAEPNQNISNLLSVFTNFLSGLGSVSNTSPITIAGNTFNCPVNFDVVMNLFGQDFTSSELGIAGLPFNGGIREVCDLQNNNMLWIFNNGSPYFPQYGYLGTSSTNIFGSYTLYTVVFVGCILMTWAAVKGLFYTIKDAVEETLDFGGSK